MIGANSMRAVKAVLELRKMKALFFDEEVQMCKICSCLFCIDLMECNRNDIKERYIAVEQALIVEEDKTVEWRKF